MIPTLKPTAQVTLTADIVVLREGTTGSEILLIQRGREPYAGMYALPGGKVNTNESVEQAAYRELEEETGIHTPSSMQQAATFSDPGRDPRGRYVSIAFLCLLEDSSLTVQAGDDADAAGWFALHDLPELAFDHKDIIAQVAAPWIERALMSSRSWFKLKEARDYLQVSRSTFYRMMWSGQITGRKIGSTWRFLFSDLQACVKQVEKGCPGDSVGVARDHSRCGIAMSPKGEGNEPVSPPL